jgi:hypothetical protein
MEIMKNGLFIMTPTEYVVVTGSLVMKLNNKSLSLAIGEVMIRTLVYRIKSRFILSTVVVTGFLVMKLNNKSRSLAIGGVEIRTLVYGIKSRFI